MLRGTAVFVDVLRGEAEVDEFLFCLQGLGLAAVQRVDLFLDEVFHGLDVVVGYALNVLHAGGICLGEVGVDGAQQCLDGLCDACQLWQGEFCKTDEIFDFDTHAIANECELGEIVGQVGRLGAVSPVDGRNGREHVQFHSRGGTNAFWVLFNK